MAKGKKSKGRYYKSITRPAAEVVRRSTRIAVTLADNLRAGLAGSRQNEATNSITDTSRNDNPPQSRCPFAQYGCDKLNPTSKHIAQCPWRLYSVINTTVRKSSDDQSMTFQLPKGKIDVAHATALFQRWLEEQQSDPIHNQKRQYDHISADPYVLTGQRPQQRNDQQHDKPNGNTSFHTDFAQSDYFPTDGMEPFTDFDFDYAECEQNQNIRDGTVANSDCILYGRSTFDPTLKTATSSITYDDYTALQVMLMSNIMQFRGVPLSLFDSIQHTIRYWAFHRNLDFNRREIFRTRESLLNQLKSYHGMHDVKSEMVNVSISRGRVVGVVVFDLVSVICNMLSDSRIFCPENIAHGYNMWNATGEPSEIYGEIHTGIKFQEARDYFIGDTDQFALPLITFYDKTHTDNKGALSAAPFNITLAFLNIETRMKSYAQFPIGIIPNLRYGLSSDENITPMEGVNDEQECLYPILKKLIDIEKSKGFEIEILGVKVTGRPWIHLSIGDIAGHQSMLACYADNSGKTKRPNRMCRCSSYVYDWEEMKCEWVTLKEVKEARDEYHANVGIQGRKGYAESVMKNISRHPIETVWEKGVPVADQVHGMNILTPPELLHTVGVGIAKYILSSINTKLGKSESQVLDRLHAGLYYDMKRNSDRDFYESSLHKGSTESVKQSGMENIGNVLAILCLSVTAAGHHLLTRNKIGDDEKDVSHPLKLFMACISWFHSSNPKEEVHNAGGLVSAVLHDIIEFIERKDGQGWDIPKCHAWLQFVQYMKFFGNGMNFWGGPGEHSHIRLLKDNARRTQKQVPKFGRQVAQRICEDVILEKAEECLINQLHDDVLEMPHSSSLYKKLHEWRMNRVDMKIGNSNRQMTSCHLIRCEGKHSITLSFKESEVDQIVHEGNVVAVTHSVVWATGNSKKQRQNRMMCVEMLIFLSRLAAKAGENELRATGYHAAHVQFQDIEEKSIIRCTDRFDTKPWYDYIAFNRNGRTLAAKVCGVVSMGNKKVLVVHAMEEVEVDSDEVPFNIIKEMDESFLVKFSLGNVADCIYSVEFDDVIAPLIVFPDYGRNVKQDCVCLLPKRRWTRYFSLFLRNSHFWPSNE